MSGCLKFFMTTPNREIQQLLESQYLYEPTKEYLDADFIVFSGGADIPPEVAYFEDFSLERARKVDPHVDYWYESSLNRTKIERKYFSSAVARGVPCVGICRGAQLLWALSGNEVWQDVDGHRGSHEAWVLDVLPTIKHYDTHMYNVNNLKKITITSTHHQQCRTDTVKTPYIPLVGARKSTTKRSWNGCKVVRAIPDPKLFPMWHHTSFDLEAFVIPETLSFGCQFHPEYEQEDSRMREWFCDTLAEFLYTDSMVEKE